MPDIVTMQFVNRDSAEEVVFQVERSATVWIARWYGGFCAGDDYDVLIDGEVVDKDINGEIG